ncbi:toxin-antitoxin system HicB family antitoxin [Streptomyces sp. NPDC042319]|uniref:toxin-antitoxin system HicB family antitoxin n=1 Tax=Streptomyces sp. NPDC042319 TaxID=3154332 RepID=UPI0033C66AA0
MDLAPYVDRLRRELESAVRLALLDALSDATAETTRDLTPDPVDVRPGPAEGEAGGTARINFRLPTHLKTRAEEAAAREGLSVNTWLVRATAAALEPGARDHPAGRGHHGPQKYTGWVR